MAYARWGPGSHVYVFHHIHGYLTCLACSLNDESFSSFDTTSPQTMLNHLHHHRAMGQLVPQSAIDRLQDEIAGTPHPTDVERALEEMGDLLHAQQPPEED